MVPYNVRLTMKAVLQPRYGAAEVLAVGEIPPPEPGESEVLVQVRAAGLDRGTWHLMTGKPYVARLAIGLRRPKNLVPGLDVAGVVVAVGAKVTRFKVGDEVFGIAQGSFAELARAREDKLVHKPAKLSFEHAAITGISGMTALQALRDAGKVRPGQKVLIIGASGGVGSFAVQIAKAMGAEVTGVASTAKLELLRSIGADHVIDYTQTDFTRADRRYDVILDIGGIRPLSSLRRILEKDGTIVFVGGENGGDWTGGFFGRPILGLLLSPFTKQKFRMLTSKEHDFDLQELAKLIEAEKISPVLDQTYPLERAAEAMRSLEAGQIRGKVAIAVG